MADDTTEKRSTGRATASKEFRVICAGLNYRTPGDEHPTGFALNGAVVQLDAAEGERLRSLGCVIGAGEPLPEHVEDPNGYGGRALEDLEEHAQRARTAAKK